MKKHLVLLSACLAVAACSSPESDSTAPVAASPAPASVPAPAPAAPAPAAAPAGPAVKLYALNCGDLKFADVDFFADDGSMKGVNRDFIDPCYLIRHPAGDLLWDTGVPEAIADMPDGLKPEGFPVHILVRKKLTAQLAELGMVPANVDFVSFSHMHFDHTGNGNLFAASTWIVDADERAAMFSDKARAGEDFAAYKDLENAKTVTIDGDATHDVFGDGSVVIHQAPGHTPGHAVLLVKTAASGAVLLTGDMWHLAESREKRLVPSFNADRAQTVASMDKVESLAASNNARIVRQHVPEDFASLPAFPQPLQ
jgi:N-acyl homoserine lactone hydrolase